MYKRNYKIDAQIALFAMKYRYAYFGTCPWIEGKIIPRNEVERRIAEKEERKIIQYISRKTGRFII